MGTSTDAILFYGYCWEDEAPTPAAIDKDVSDEETERWERKAQTLGEKLGCEVGQHCSAECPMPYVAIAASEIRAWRGCSKHVENLNIDPARAEQLADFCARLDIDVGEQTPRWWLVSMWN